MRLPEKIRGTLEKLVKNMKNNENVSAVALFGSWSRGDAVAASSDVDLLVVDTSGFEDEYVERREFGGLLIDFDYLPKSQLTGQIMPETDQKLYEAYVLYDRDWRLTTVKNRVARNYASRERVDIRTEAHMVDADIYFSRANSALVREDLQSAVVFAALSVEEALKILLEAQLQPLSSSRLVASLEAAAAKEGMTREFIVYLTVSRLQNETRESAERRLIRFRTVLNQINAVIRDHEVVFDSLHFKVRSRLNYYGAVAFLPGMVLRSRSLIDTQACREASHYMSRTLVDVLENYAWLRSAVTGVKFDYTTLFRSLKNLEKASSIYRNAAEALGVENVSREDAQNAVKLAKEAIVNIRRRRKELIARNIKQ